MHSDIRRKIAEEAARLIYNRIYSEYKQAKEAAARSLGVNTIPSNYEVAIELDLLSDRIESTEKQKRLIKLREKALSLMKILKDYSPKLTGSVWRGTARKNSDIDINIYAEDLKTIIKILQDAGYELHVEEVIAVHKGRSIRATHIHIVSLDAEIIIRPLEEKLVVNRCEIYGDPKKGLSLEELEKTLKNDPIRKFVPVRRQKR